ncbi:MAG: YegP family protein [Candidatus Aminicenantaceae bacterium]
MSDKYEIYKDKRGGLRFRLRTANNQIIATGERNSSKDACKKCIGSAKKSASVADIVDTTD